MTFANRFITQRDEAVWNDCTVCSVLMSLGFATLDAIFLKADRTVMTAAEVKTMRERLRALTGDTTGGTSIEDLMIGTEKMFPWMDVRCEHLQLSTIEARWEAGWSGAIQGNPSAVTNASSPLRRWTNNDNFGHAVKAGPMHSTGTKVLVQDPLGFGTYTGQWVLLTEVRQFMRAMRRADTTYHTFLVQEGSLLSTVTTIDRTVVPRPFSVAKGIRKIGYVLDAKTGRYILKTDKTLAAPLTGSGHLVDVKQYPGTIKPVGASFLIVSASDPAFAGTVVSTAAVAVGPAPAAGGFSQVDLDKARLEGVSFGKLEGVKAGFNEGLAASESLIHNVPRR